DIYAYNGSGSNFDYQNNIFSNVNNGFSDYCVYVNYAAVENNNDLYFSGSNLITYAYTTYSDISSYQSATGLGARDTTLNPKFNSKTDLHINNAILVRAGTPIKYVKTDIDGYKRSSKNPSIGADEYTLPALQPVVDNITN